MNILRLFYRPVRTNYVAALSGVLLALLSTRSVSAADLISVLPVTNEVLLLNFREGHIDYNGMRPDGTYEPQTENRVYSGKLLDIEAATDKLRYVLTSVEDRNYADGLCPIAMGYKSKGTEFNSPYKAPPFLREYWIYAVLPSPLQPGKTYSVQVGDLAENLKQYRFLFDEKSLRSPTIHVNQVGFPLDAPKYAYFSQWMGTLETLQYPDGALNLSNYVEGVFHICDARSGEVRKTYHGLSLQKSRKEDDPSFGNWTRADVYGLDFSDFQEPGQYIVVAERMGCSYPFEIGEASYFEPHRAVMRGLFLQRRGIAKDLPEFAREYPRSHHPDINEFVAGKVEGEGGKINDAKPVQGIWGWYADAGDWDGNPTHYVVPLTLLLTYDLRPGHFGDGDIGNRWKQRIEDPWIEEGSNGIPDILDEARWWIDFCKRARRELKQQGLGTGGVPRYVGRDAGATDSPSWADRRVQWVDSGVAETTYAYAAAAAYFAHCLNEHHERSGQNGSNSESAEWIDEARDAFAWGDAQEKLSETDHRLRELAACCLYLATGEGSFQDIFKAEWENDKQRNDGAWVSPSTSMLASAIYVGSCGERPNVDTSFLKEVTANVVAHADYSTNITQTVGFRVGGVEPGQGIGMNLITVPRTIYQAVAYEATGDRKYLDAMHTALAYVLGGNQEGRSRLSGVGHEREQDAFIPDAWYLLDFNHPAYRNPIFPGLSTYAIPTFDVGGPGSESWARGSALPDINRWPLGEQRMRSRYSIAGSEFTIHQNHPWYAFATGYLLPDRLGDSPPFSRPTVRLSTDVEETPAADGLIRLSAKASADTARVEYYYDWHFAGGSREAEDDFAFSWDLTETDLESGAEVRITAIAYDWRGEPSIPSPAGESRIGIAEGPSGEDQE
jgi:hypothetical protein